MYEPSAHPDGCAAVFADSGERPPERTNRLATLRAGNEPGAPRRASPAHRTQPAERMNHG
ncbi:hypothetical protein SSAG_05611 [Streptomyces sp. Mg1]|nr:hypothetical protein SSAG_05611 [Streptomyces sp. Mg1]